MGEESFPSEGQQKCPERSETHSIMLSRRAFRSELHHEVFAHAPSEEAEREFDRSPQL